MVNEFTIYYDDSESPYYHDEAIVFSNMIPSIWQRTVEVQDLFQVDDFHALF